MLTNTALTLYNKYYDSGTKEDVYQRTVIPAVMWENRKAANTLASGGRIAANQAAVYIPKAQGADYVAPKAWLALVDKTGKWTLQDGDILIKGTVVTEIGGTTTSTVIRDTYDDVLEITSVDTIDMGSVALQHWEVGAK